MRLHALQPGEGLAAARARESPFQGFPAPASEGWWSSDHKRQQQQQQQTQQEAQSRSAPPHPQAHHRGSAFGETGRPPSMTLILLSRHPHRVESACIRCPSSPACTIHACISWRVLPAVHHRGFACCGQPRRSARARA